MGVISKTFVGANRIFGGLAVLGGVVTIGQALFQLIRGECTLYGFLVLLGIGVGLLVVGVIYMKAPLFRRRLDPEPPK